MSIIQVSLMKDGLKNTDTQCFCSSGQENKYIDEKSLLPHEATSQACMARYTMHVRLLL